MAIPLTGKTLAIVKEFTLIRRFVDRKRGALQHSSITSLFRDNNPGEVTQGSLIDTLDLYQYQGALVASFL